MDGVVVGERFKIGKIIGFGGFGELREGVEIGSEDKVAIKLEPVNTEYSLLEHESEIYKHLHGGPGIPKLKWFGEVDGHNVMVIELLGQSLADLLESSGGTLDMKTVSLLAIQLIVTLQYIHSRGVVHRDIKPENLLMGLGSNAHKVYLADFGLAGYYKDLSSDEHIPFGEGKSFVGTYCYASVFTHYGIERSRRDDLDSLGYVLLYLLRGSLPWQDISEGEDKEEYNDKILNAKYETSIEELCDSCPRAISVYFKFCRSLAFREDPRYDCFKDIFLSAFTGLAGYGPHYIYDLAVFHKDDKKKVPSSSSPLIKALDRNGFGKRGKECVIKANHFLVGFSHTDPYQYDVTITPEVISMTKSREILRQLITLYNQSHLWDMSLAYDGKKSAFAAGPLPFESKEFVVKLTESNGLKKEFKVNIKFAARKDLDPFRPYFAKRVQYDNPHEAVQALAVVFREAASTIPEKLGRSLYSSQFGQGRLGDGVEYWKGFYQSVRRTQMGLSLNIDMSARAFFEPKLVTEFVSDFLMKDLMRPLSDKERMKVKRALRGVRVEVRGAEDNSRRYKVEALTVQPTNELTFPVDETGATISADQYFRENYNINLRYPHLPAIQAGSDSKPIYLPMEICRIVEGQRYAMKLNQKQVTNLLRATCQRPHEREESIVKTMRSNQYNQSRLLKEGFGMSVSDQLTSIDARVLPTPSLKYKGTQVRPTLGQWNMINRKMIKGGTVNYWAVANFSRHRDDAVGRFVGGLVSMCQKKGIGFDPKPLIPIYHSAPDEIGKALEDITKRCKRNLQLLFVILPEAKGTYPTIKRVCEIKLGIVSQCCKPQHVQKMRPQYFENVALKINVKVGGRNTVLADALANKLPFVNLLPTIIFGAHVTHPSPGEDSSPSIAAVVASMDWPQVTKYKALVSAQPRRQEIIEDLYSPIQELLLSFKQSTGHKPSRIIFYRGGISEGQFSEVLMSEMDKIRKACGSLEEGYLPPVTFIVVQKRHHTRFFPVDSDKSGNILPGTVVDTKICHPTEFDFYLCSHAGIQGTSRPTHYHVLYDENKFSADCLQNLTYQLCYTYQRCTRSVSVVAPAYYAYLAACRARIYMKDDLPDSASSHGAGGPRATGDCVADVRTVPVIHENVKNVMFYC